MSDNNSISNADLMNVLLSLKGDVGELKGHVSGTQLILAAHISEDKVLGESVHKLALIAAPVGETLELVKASIIEHGISIKNLQLAQARQKGFVTAISAVGAALGTMAGAGLGYLVDLFTRGHH